MRRHRVVIAALGLLVAGSACADEDPLARLRLDHAALAAAEADFRARRDHGTLVGVEASDYAAYIARLQRRVIEDCVQLSRSGTRPPAELSCPETLPARPGPADIDLQSEHTLMERVAELDAELGRGLGDFDEMLLREQERIKAATPRTGATGNGTGRGTGGEPGTAGGATAGTGEGNGRSGGEAGSADREEGAGEATGAGADTTVSGSGVQGAGAGGSGGQQTVYAPPADIPDGSNDDVVARQLREAAQKEPDPELRKKLWDEYRKYKQGTR